MTVPVRRGREVLAERGTTLRCKGWRQETILRMLENNLENAEDPDNLVIYMSIAKAARNWESFDRIVGTLLQLETDQTLVMQSGKPVGVFPGQSTTPLVVMSNGFLVGGWSHDEKRREYEAAGLTITTGMTAAAWQYIGSQGILQGTYETFMSAARKHFGGDLRGRLLVTAGLGGMSGAQPLAGKMAGAATLIAEVDRARIERRIATGYLDGWTDDLDEALARAAAAQEAGEGVSIGYLGNVVDLHEALIARGITPDILTDQTFADPAKGYCPVGWTVAEARAAQDGEADRLMAAANETLVRHVGAMLTLRDRGALVFEYGNSLRAHAEEAGLKDAFGFGSFVDLFIRPLFCEGIGPFRWIAPSGDAKDIETIDNLIEENFSPNHRIVQWIRMARTHVKFTGLPARIGWLGYGERSRLALLVNDAVRDGRISAPIAFTRDHLDSGSAALPHRETENMADGSDAIADWPILNALLNCASGADLVAIHGLGARGVSAGVTVIADGTEDAATRLVRVLDGDTGIGVLRHADAGYERAQEKAAATGLSATLSTIGEA